MLEKHIIQSRARATAAEIVKSTFRWCVDNSLLKQHNLICPEDYITEQRLMTKAPRGKSTPGFINPTLSFSKHISRLPQDDGYTEIPPPHATAESLLEESEGSLTLPSTPDSNFTVTKSSNKKSSQARKTVKKEESGSSWPEETAALLKLEERHNLLRNPRFLPPNAHRGGKSLIFPVKKVGKMAQQQQNDPHEPIPVFLANPPIVFFTDYRLGKIYEVVLGVLFYCYSSAFITLPITSKYFTVLGKFPGEGGIVAPGMSCHYTVRFAPDSLADFEDFVLVETQAPYPLVVTFFPLSPENVSQTFSIVCDNCQVKDITTKGTGQLIALQLVSVSEGEDRPALGELCDLTAEHFIRFATANPHSLCQKKLVIRNSAHLELPFHWQIMKPNLQFLLPGEKIESMKIESQLATDGAFQINPTQGIFAPHQDHEFTLSYSPHELKDYHSVCHLVLRDIRIPEAPEDSKGNRTDQPLERRATVNDVIVMEIEVKGSTEPYKVLLEPYAIHIPGENFIGTTIKRRFKMWNNSKSHILFHWDRISDCHIMEVEPPSGIIEVNECCDLELALTGGKPGSTVLNLDCHIEHHCEPITLVVEAVFKIVIEPCSGLLPALATCSVDVMFKPSVCQHFQTVLELVVENGSGCHLSVQANVQSPQVCLLSCELVFSELYVGVPALSSVRLFNQTLLPAHFSWGELKGKQSSLCSVSFSPSSGTLGPNAEEEIAVELTAYTDKELTDVAALCLVRDMKEPLVLGFFAKAKPLHVTFSLPSDRYVIFFTFRTTIHYLCCICLQRCRVFFPKAGDLDPVFIPVKMSVRGCPLYFQMMGPQKDKQTQGPIIRFGTQISGGDTVSRSLRINNISQYDIRVDWETFNKEKGDVKLVDLVVSCGEAFPLKDVDGNEVLGGYVGPSGSRERRRDWDRISSTGETTSTVKMQSKTLFGNSLYEEEDTEEESDTDEQTAAMRKVVFVNLRQHEGTVSDYPYCITPQQIIVPAGGSATIHVSFTPLTLSETVNKTECVGFALGYMSLDSELACCIPGKVFRSQGFEQEPLRLDLQAFVKPALLTVEMEEDEDEIVFCARASDLIPEEPHKMMVKDSVLTHNLHLRNSTETPLYFRLLAKPPFSVLHTEAKSSTRSSHSDRGEVRLLFLKPQNNMQVKVAFHNSLSLLPYQSQPEGQLPPGVQLVHSETGERTLQFQQDLVVEYSNKTVQIVPLCARLSLPTLQLSCDSLDFGTCYVGQTRVKEVFLSNRGGSSSYWTALIEAPEKPCGFTVSPGNGVLKPFGYPCSTSRGALQISFIASDSAEYKATVTIHGMLGEQPVRLEVTGKGSYDEKYDSL
uniref:DLEC1 cilia and flagella associated protein n=1 Tax=Lepisosteus oculatus TaxID=7918 RepID=W5MU66_LEPOC